MSAVTAAWITLALGLYAGAGLLFALPFVVWGLPRIDTATRGTSFAFRLVILPGTAALWPVLLRLWLRSSR